MSEPTPPKSRPSRRWIPGSAARPLNDGKAERFIQTSLREWIYAEAYALSSQRTAAMPAWLYDYNTQRPYSALGGKPPISKLTDNACGNDIYCIGPKIGIDFRKHDAADSKC